MGSDQSTTFAYCGRNGGEDEDEIERNAQILSYETNRGNNSSNINMEDVQQELHDARDEIKGMLQQYEKIKEENDSKYTQLKEQYEKEREQKTKAMAQIQNSKSRYEELIEIIKEEHAREIEALRRKYDEYKHGIAPLYDSVDIAQQIINYKQNEQIDIAQNEPQQNKIDQLQKDLEEARKKIKSLTSDTNYSKLNDQYHNECHQNSELMNQLQESKERYAELLNSQKSLNEKYETVLEKCSTSDVKQQNKTVEFVANDAENKSIENELLMKRNKELEEKVAELMNIIEEYKAQKITNHHDNEKSVQIEQENESLKNELQATKMDLVQKQRTITILNQQLSLTQNQLTTYRNEQLAQNKSLKSVMSDDTDMSEERVLNTFDRSRQINDVEDYVRDRYRTIDKGKNHNISGDGTHETNESSYSEEEKLEITKGNENMNGFLNTAEGSIPNLFRYESKDNWDPDAVAKQKQAMKEHMVRLLQQQSAKTDNIETQKEND